MTESEVASRAPSYIILIGFNGTPSMETGITVYIYLCVKDCVVGCSSKAMFKTVRIQLFAC